MIKTFSQYLNESVSDKERYQLSYGAKPKWDKMMQHQYPDDPVKSALYDYVAGYTTCVNNYLRAGKENVCKDITDDLDQAFQSQAILDVYRTVDSEYMQNVYNFDIAHPENMIGQTLVNKGYMSTTYEFQSPWGSSWMDGDIIMHITSSKPVPCADINSIFDADEIDCEDQKECLLPRNINLKITDVKIVNKKTDKRFSKTGNIFIEMTVE